MKAAPMQEWYDAVSAKIDSLLEHARETPSWRRKWKKLRTYAPNTDILRLFQAIRDSDFLPEDAGFYLISRHIDAITNIAVERELADVQARLRSIEAAHGVPEGEALPNDQRTEEYEDLVRQYLDGWDRLFAGNLAEFGEEKMKQLFTHSRERYEQLEEAGRQYFRGPNDPSSEEGWLEEVVHTVGTAMELTELVRQFAVWYTEEDDHWHIRVYPLPAELVGGAVDGTVFSPPFRLNIEAVRSAFQEVEESGWDTQGTEAGLSSFVWFKGTYQARKVHLQILAAAPPTEMPGTKLFVIEVSRK